MKFTTKSEVQSVVGGLRRELKELKKPTDQLSFNDVLNVLAKAMKFGSWNEMEASLMPEPKAREAAALKESKYPLRNDGQFDFVPRGVNGEVFSGQFVKLESTMEKLVGTAGVDSVSRQSGDGKLEIEYGGSTDVDWDSQKTQKDEKGNVIWMDEYGNESSSPAIVIAPEDCCSPEDDEDLPIRNALVEAFEEYFAETGLLHKCRHNDFSEQEEALGRKLSRSKALAILIEDAGRTIGYALTERETELFEERLAPSA